MRCVFGQKIRLANKVLVRQLFFLLFISVQIAPLFAQDDYFLQTYGVKEGLPSEEVYDVLQDHYGYIWVATANGVARFDGRNFETFRSDNLPASDALSLYEDSSNRLWVLYNNGKALYWKGGEWHTPQNDSALASIQSSTFFISFLEDKKGDFWLGNLKGEIWSMSKEGRMSFLPTPSSSLAGVWLIEDANNRVWAAYKKDTVGLEKIIKTKCQLLFLPHLRHLHYLHSVQLW